jgi:oxepin-CoA hydrolase/3-oxo-5,6-dehydrosuberyl-CoA semialdehyde dehydrogenase
MQADKLQFIVTGFVPLLQPLSADTIGKWGKMNAQQMAEHVAGFFKVSTEKIKFPVVTPMEHLSKYKEFLWSDKEFRENTKAPAGVVPDEPMPTRKASMAAALEELQQEIDHFVQYFKNHPGAKTAHPVFGELDFDEWVQLHHKHVTHHARQFGVL